MSPTSAKKEVRLGRDTVKENYWENRLEGTFSLCLFLEKMYTVRYKLYMSTRLTIQDIHSRLSKTDLTCLEDSYKHPYLLMQFKCKDGHKFKMRWADVERHIKNRLPVCPACKQVDKFTSNHQRIIESLSLQLKGARKYGFAKALIKAVAKWNLIWELREQGIISEDVVPDKKFIQKELHKPICSECDGDPKSCGCNAEPYTLFDELKYDLMRDLKLRPDLHIIDEDKFEIIAIEVEDTYRVSIDKLVEYADLWDALNYYSPDTKFNLFLYDRFGNKLGAINLELYYRASISPNFEENYVSVLEELEQEFPRIESEILGYYRKARFHKDRKYGNLFLKRKHK